MSATITAARTPRPFPTTSTWRPRAAAAAYVGAWIVGLTAFGAGPAADASDAVWVRHIAEHRAATALQSVVVHGLAALALFAVVTASRLRSTSRVAHAAALAAIGLSLAQCALGLWRSVASTGATTSTLVHTIDRIDGVKMLALAVMIAAGTLALRMARRIGRGSAALGALATACLVVAGVAYTAAIGALLAAAAPALVLLLAWVATFAFTIGRTAH